LIFFGRIIGIARLTRIPARRYFCDKYLKNWYLLANGCTEAGAASLPALKANSRTARVLGAMQAACTANSQADAPIHGEKCVNGDAIAQ
jgi:hypothetical protein